MIGSMSVVLVVEEMNRMMAVVAMVVKVAATVTDDAVAVFAVPTIVRVIPIVGVRVGSEMRLAGALEGTMTMWFWARHTVLVTEAALQEQSASLNPGRRRLV